MKIFFRRTAGLIFVWLIISAGVLSPQTPDVHQQQLTRFVGKPLPGRIAATGTPSFYKPDTLYQYIDGAADVYLLYDFQSLLHQDFKNGAAELSADIYEMKTPEDAFGMFSSERSASYKFTATGIEGYHSKGLVNFVQDRFYIKLTGSGTNADLSLDQLANTISARIGGIRLLPALFRKLPRGNLVPHSQQYIRKDPLGHAFLSPAYVVAYESSKGPSKLLISVAADSAAAKSRIDQLAAHLKQTGQCNSAPELGSNGTQGKNSFEGRFIARTQGRYLILMLNPPANGSEILKAVAQSLS